MADFTELCQVLVWGLREILETDISNAGLQLGRDILLLCIPTILCSSLLAEEFLPEHNCVDQWQ